AVVSHKYSDTGAYQVELIIESDIGCKDTIVKEIKIDPHPVAGFTFNPEEPNPKEDVQFVDTSKGADAWQWSFGDSSNNSTLSDPMHSYGMGGTFTVNQLVTNEYNCTDTLIRDINVKGSLPPVLPSGFSPNNDGENDVLYVKGGPFKSLNLKIYNKWGKKVFESNNKQNGWNGKKNGEDQPVGVYVYVLQVTTVDGKEHELTGDVTLIR
ncbi:MAG: gliding motility-associated C-terminal domain-containing protein, partial [Flavobacteriales bacterium]